MDNPRQEKKNRHIAARLFYLGVSLLFFLHAFGVLNFLDYKHAAAFAGLSPESIAFGAIFSWVLFLVVLSICIIRIILLTVQLITKKEYRITKLLQILTDKLNDFSRNMLSNVRKFLLALVLAGILYGVVVYLQVLDCGGKLGACKNDFQYLFFMAGFIILFFALFYNTRFLNESEKRT